MVPCRDKWSPLVTDGPCCVALGGRKGELAVTSRQVGFQPIKTRLLALHIVTSLCRRGIYTAPRRRCGRKGSPIPTAAAGTSERSNADSAEPACPSNCPPTCPSPARERAMRGTETRLRLYGRMAGCSRHFSSDRRRPFRCAAVKMNQVAPCGEKSSIAECLSGHAQRRNWSVVGSKCNDGDLPSPRHKWTSSADALMMRNV